MKVKNTVKLQNESKSKLVKNIKEDIQINSFK